MEISDGKSDYGSLAKWDQGEMSPELHMWMDDRSLVWWGELQQFIVSLSRPHWLLIGCCFVKLNESQWHHRAKERKEMNSEKKNVMSIWWGQGCLSFGAGWLGVSRWVVWLDYLTRFITNPYVGSWNGKKSFFTTLVLSFLHILKNLYIKVFFLIIIIPGFNGNRDKGH